MQRGSEARTNTSSRSNLMFCDPRGEQYCVLKHSSLTCAKVRLRRDTTRQALSKFEPLRFEPLRFCRGVQEGDAIIQLVAS